MGWVSFSKNVFCWELKEMSRSPQSISSQSPPYRVGVEGLGSSTKTICLARNCMEYSDLHRKSCISFGNLPLNLATPQGCMIFLCRPGYFMLFLPNISLVGSMNFVHIWTFHLIPSKRQVLEINPTNIWAGMVSPFLMKKSFARN